MRLAHDALRDASPRLEGLGIDASEGRVIVGPVFSPSYSMGGQGMTQAQFVAWAAALKKVSAS